MFSKAFEFGRAVFNVVTYDDTEGFKKEAVARLTNTGSKKITGESIGVLRKKLEEENSKRKLKGLPLLLLALPLSACGGSDDAEVAVVFPEVAGRAIDGYLIGSRVSLSSDPDTFVETISTAGEQGKFEGLFGTGSIVVSGGVDIATGKSFTGELRAPAPKVVTDEAGNQTVEEFVVTPLTTLVEAVVSAAAESGAAPVSVEVASAQVAKGLGLTSDSDLLKTDFVADGSAGMAKAAAQVASVIAVVTASAGEEVSAAVLTNIATKVAKAGEVGGKAKVLTDSAELTTVFAEVIETQEELFTDTPEGLDLNVFVESISESVTTVNAKVEAAETLKDIVATQQLVQEDLVAAFTIDLEEGEEFDAASFGAALTELSENFDAKLEEAAAELEVYLASEDLGFDLEVELDFSDSDTEAVTLDLALIDGAIEGTIDEALITGFVFGDVDETLLAGVLDGTVDQAEIDAVLEDLPVYEVFPDIPDIEIPVDEIPVDEVPVDEIPVDEIPVVVIPISSGGPTLHGATTADDIQTVINSMDVGDILVLAAGRYDQNFTVNKDIEIRGANYGVSVHADNDDTVAEVYFDTADAARAGGTNESWINGTVTVASDGVTLDGLRMHAYKGPLEFSGTDIDNFTLKNSYVTGFEGSKSFRYVDEDGVASTGWAIQDNLIGGVAGGTGGSLYLTGVTDTVVDDNVFWRPGAAHMYLEDVSSLTVSNNFFLQGLHADGANQDNLLDDLVAQSSFGYVGFDGNGTGNIGGYGYGFGYGYDGSEAVTSMGYGLGAEGGYGPTGYFPSGYGLSGSGGGTSYTYHGRNYVAEVKGVSSDVTFSGNSALYNSGGIQFWDENSSSNYFTNITISDNTFSEILNADPDGFLSSISSRHKSGLMGAVTFSTVDGSASSGLAITGNTFTGRIDQIKNDNDIDSLILVQGEVDNANVSNNSLTWTVDGTTADTATNSSFSSAFSSLTGGSSDRTGSTETYEIYTQGVHLLGDAGADAASKIALQNNTFETYGTNVASYISDGILLDYSDYSSLSLGQLSSTVYIVDSGSVSTTAYADSADFGNYASASSDYISIATSGTAGTITFSSSDIM